MPSNTDTIADSSVAQPDLPNVLDDAELARAQVCVVILAAGKSTRMKSKIPKALHPLRGALVIEHIVRAAQTASGQPPVVVIGASAGEMQKALGITARTVLQAEQLGTGHAVLQAEALVIGSAQVVVTYGDMPLLRSEVLYSAPSSAMSWLSPGAMVVASLKNPR